MFLKGNVITTVTGLVVLVTGGYSILAGDFGDVYGAHPAANAMGNSMLDPIFWTTFWRK
jgi:hypothetical protein